jgi:hypothetical protein
MTQIHGQATIRINGQVYESQDDASLMVGGIKNNVRMIGQKTVRNETILPSKVKCKIPISAGMSLVMLQSLSGAEVTFESDMGQIWIIRDAAQTAELDLSGGSDGGLVELELMGEPAEEMTNV